MAEGRAGWAIWVVGLPGSGKSTLARGVLKYFLAKKYDVTLLEMDQRRKEYFPDPTYSAEEREQAYVIFVEEAAVLVRQGKNVLMDGSAYKRDMRQYARQQIERFVEIFVQCDLEEAIRRESARPQGKVMAGLYQKALERQRTGKVFPGLGEVIGVDVEFELDWDAELVIDNTALSTEETLGKALHFLDSWLGDA